MIRKEGKARWVYECQYCNDRVECVDEFRAIEYGQWHEKSYQHAFTAIGASFKAIADELSKSVMPAMEALNRIFEPPKNPHDPSLLKDRRKWGGR